MNSSQTIVKTSKLRSAKSIAAILGLPVFLSSCATLLNGPTMNIHIATDEKIKGVSVDNALYSDNIFRQPKDSETYLVRRCHETLVIRAKLDSSEKIIRIRPHLSAAFWFNIENYGLGVLVDIWTPKRFGYRRWYYLVLKDTAITLRRFAPVPKRTLSFSLSVPFINAFSLTSPEGSSAPAGPFGLGVGLDYFYKTNQYFSLSLGVGTSAFADHIGVGYYYIGNVGYISIRNSHVVGSFDLGYGLSFSDLHSSKVTMGDTATMVRTISTPGMGFSFSAQYRLSRYCRLGILYQPIIFSVNSPHPFSYQYYLAAGFAWRWPT